MPISFINPSKFYFPTTGDVPAGKYDFYQVATHELGHAIGLGHSMNLINNIQEVMYYRVYANGVSASERINLSNTFGARTKTGGIAKINIDKTTPWAVAGIATLGSATPTPPVITSHPPDTIRGCVGQSVSFGVSAIGGALSYQWQFSINNGFTFINMTNNTTFGGTNTATLTITNPSTTIDNRFYRCIVSHTNGSCTAISKVTVHKVSKIGLQSFAAVYKDAAAFALTCGTPLGGSYSGIGVSNGFFNPQNVAAGTYTITYTRNICRPVSISRTIEVLPALCCNPVIVINAPAAVAVCLYPGMGNGAVFTLQYSALGNYTAGNIFTAQLSDASGSFANPVAIGSILSTGSGSIAATVPASIAVGNGYKARIISTSPAVTSMTSINVSVRRTSSEIFCQQTSTEKVIVRPADYLVQLYPNPVSNELFVEQGGDYGLGYVKISTTHGRLLINQVLESGAGQQTIHTAGLPAGMYLLEIRSANGSGHRQMFVKK